jgi:hypothetical protein
MLLLWCLVLSLETNLDHCWLMQVGSWHLMTKWLPYLYSSATSVSRSTAWLGRSSLSTNTYPPTCLLGSVLPICFPSLHHRLVFPVGTSVSQFPKTSCVQVWGSFFLIVTSRKQGPQGPLIPPPILHQYN